MPFRKKGLLAVAGDDCGQAAAAAAAATAAVLEAKIPASVVLKSTSPVEHVLNGSGTN